jgi:hypothetical protein
LCGDSQMFSYIIKEFPEYLFAGEVVSGLDHIRMRRVAKDIEDMEAVGVELVITIVKLHERGDAYLWLEMVCEVANILLYHNRWAKFASTF